MILPSEVYVRSAYERVSGDKNIDWAGNPFDLGLTSLMIVELCNIISDQLKVDIDPDGLILAATMQDFVTYVDSRRSR